MSAYLEPNWLKQNWQHLLGALLLHVLFAGIFGLTMVELARDAPPPSLAIQGMIVDSSTLTDLPSTPKPPAVKPEPPAPPAPEPEVKPEPQVDVEAQAAEERRKEEEVKRQKEQQEEQERQVQLKREEEQKQVQEREEAERKRVADAQAQAEREKAEAKAKAEAAAKAKAESDRKRVAEIEKRQKEEADRRESQARASREAELRRQLAEEEGRTNAVNSGLLNQYVAMIEQRVVRNWNRPASARPGLQCEVRVAQTPSGTVLSAQVTQCNGDAAVKQSIEAAVLRSSPLPPPPDPSLFERNLVFIFKPAD